MKKKLCVSFTPKGDWFVFADEDGKTVKRGFYSRRGAEAHAYSLMFPQAAHARPAA